MLKTIAPAIGAAWLALSACTTPQAITQDLSFEISAAFLEAACKEDQFSGIVRVLQADTVAYEFSCTGANSDADPITSQTRFKVFSTSKHFTAALIMSLAQDDMLALDEPVTHWIDAAPESWHVVTIKDLLQHQSGLPDLTGTLLEYFKNGGRDHTKGVLDTIAASKFEVSEAPADWSYNNFNYEILVVIAEQAGGSEFESLLEERVFALASMTDTIIEQVEPDLLILASTPDPLLVAGYNGAPKLTEDASSFAFVQKGAGALHATAADLTNYIFALRDDTPLSAETQLIMRRDNVIISDTTRNGIGWFVRQYRDVETLGHSGGSNGYVSQLTYIPERAAGIVILSNYGFAPIRDIQATLLDELVPQ